MSLRSLLETPVRRLALSAALVGALAGCGGGHDCTTCPPPTKTVQIDAASLNPSTVQDGSAFQATANASATNTTVDSVAATYNGTRQSQVGNSYTKTFTAALGQTDVVFHAYGRGATTATATRTLTVTQLPPPIITITNKSVVPQNPLPGSQVTLGAQATVQNAPNIDSIAINYNNSNQKQLGSSISKTFTTASQPAWAIITAYANPTVQKDSMLVTPATLYGLHVLLQSLGTSTVNRATLDVDGTAVNVPVDTTLQLAAGAHSLGLKSGQTQAYDFGELTYGTSWFPIHPAGLAYNVTINAPGTATFGLISRSEPNFSGVAKQQHDMIWVGPDGNYHPTKIKNWDVYTIDAGWTTPGFSTPLCLPMQQSDKDGAIASIPIMTSEDSAGPDGVRRVYTYRGGDPVSAGKIIPGPNGSWRPAPGVHLMCRSNVGPGNVTFYDAQLFLDGFWTLAGGSADGWLGEFRGFDDMVYNGQEGNAQLSRNDASPLINTRTSLDTFVYDQPLRIAWRAGQNGFGLIKAPQ